MTLRVYSARLSAYQGPDAFNVTRGSGRGDGLLFAPSREILAPALRDLKRGLETERLAQNERDAQWGRFTRRRAWAVYWGAYVAEMRGSYAEHRRAWERLLAREEITLCCYCADPTICHRMILGAEILPTLGATYQGERDP